ncbi:hypothetical protein [Haloactinospora alba]|uniref:hypothetical protein n=1 Tax=Haloactinospora alba TaxID=405555 RepID=UPI00147698EB|nr:hypothetical protein [Haloactinospora alba]
MTYGTATLTWASVSFGRAAGAALAFLPRPPAPGAGAAVAALLVMRLACANLDDGLARESSGRATVRPAAVFPSTKWATVWPNRSTWPAAWQ